jgi:transposase
MRALSAETRHSVLVKLQNNKSYRRIASEMGISVSSVSRLCSSLGYSPPPSPKGRPRKLSDHDTRRLVRHILSGAADNAAQLQRTLQLSVSPQTVRNALKRAGLKAIIKVKRPLLERRHRKARLEFALCHQHWTVEDWSRVIFSDETKINRKGSDGRVWGWKRPGYGFEERNVVGTLKYGGGSTMLWGCMTISGPGHMTQVEGRMNAKQYTDILSQNLFQSATDTGFQGTDFIFQQDNDPKHTSKLAKKWFADHSIKLLRWPAQSPDLNPIEHLWGYLKRKLNAYPTDPRSIEELWQRIQQEWVQIPPDVCYDLIASMPSRIQAVLQARGGNTRY